MQGKWNKNFKDKKFFGLLQAIKKNRPKNNNFRLVHTRREKNINHE
jgi:hypothetical protein